MIPAVVSQRMTDLSQLAEAMVAASGEKATEETQLVWPLSV
jgi:hypothetical protein